MMDERRRSLATAHAALMFLALVALASLAYSWTEQGPLATAGWLETGALCLQTAVLLYLASTALAELNLAQTLRQRQSVKDALGLPMLLGHLWVLLVAAATAWRTAESRTYLAGLDWQIATLLTGSLLAIVLLMVTQRAERGSAVTSQPDPAALRQLRGLGWLHLVISLLVVFALWYLETRPLIRPEQVL
jgi:hypothetical protein